MKLSQILSEDIGNNASFSKPRTPNYNFPKTSDAEVLFNPAAVQYGDEDELGQQHPVTRAEPARSPVQVPASIAEMAKQVGIPFEGNTFQPTRPELNDKAKQMIKLIAQQATSIQEVPDLSGNLGRTVTKYTLPDCIVTTWNIGTHQADGNQSITHAMKANPYFYYMVINWAPL